MTPLEILTVLLIRFFVPFVAILACCAVFEWIWTRFEMRCKK